MTCPSCGLENPPSSMRCDCGHGFTPSAGAGPVEQKRVALRAPFKVLLASPFVLFAIAIAVSPFINSDSDLPPEARKRISEAEGRPVPSIPPPKPRLELLDHNGEKGEYSTTIRGRIRNNGNKIYAYAQVTFNLYNKADERVGTALANINNLEPGAIWRFEAVGTARADRFKLDEITGY